MPSPSPELDDAAFHVSETPNKLTGTNENPKATTTNLDTPGFELHSTPPVRSPIKTPSMTTPLLPLQYGSLRISKRRRLEPSSPAPISPDTDSHLKPMVTPSKHRSFSTPVRHATQRTPSLQDRQIPVLSPPSPPGSINSSGSVPTPGNKPTQVASPSSPISSDTSTKSSIIPPKRVTGYRRVTSPLKLKIRDPKDEELACTERDLNRELLKWRRQVEIARQAQKYQNKNDSDELKRLTCEWRSAAQKAVSELFEQAKERVEGMGGMREFVKSQKNAKKFQRTSYEMNEIDYETLSARDKKRFDALKEDYEKEVEKANKYELQEEGSTDLEFTVKYMLQSLNMDYKVVFPEAKDDDDDE